MANISKWAGIVALVISVVVGAKVFMPVTFSHSFGAAGNLFIENYVPVVRYNGGINTALPVTFGSTLNVTATTTLADTVAFTNPALCFNFFATSSATQLHMTASTTGVLPNGAAAVLTADYGACTN